MAAWRKSSSSHANGNCVEIASHGAAVQVRDSKNPSGPVLSFSRAEWAAFTGRITRKDQRRVPPARMVPVRRHSRARRPGH
jgi:hypothetical protein